MSIFLAAESADQSLGTLPLILLLIGIPAAVALLISLIVLGPKWSRAGRWRPGQPWSNDPMWFGDGAPEDVDRVLAAANSDADLASLTVGDVDIEPVAEESLASVTDPGPGAQSAASLSLGGARGRW